VSSVQLRSVAEGLRFPEGPVFMKDGSIVVVEIERRTVTRIARDGTKSVLSQHSGGPNGLAVGPDGAFYVCNNGGFSWTESDGLLVPAGVPLDYVGGSIERVDPRTGIVTTLYDRCGGHRLCGPNDLVFDRHGGFYFTDLGKHRERERDYGGVYYAAADGSRIVEFAYPVITPNGCGLSPDGMTFYVVELETSRLWAYDLIAPGVAAKSSFPQSLNGGRLICGLPGFQCLDGIALDAEGNICMACVWGTNPRLVAVSPSGKLLREVPMPEAFPTNLCFGGPNMKTVYITLSGTGRVVAMDWDKPGLHLSYEF
jgi:gluconolactonase